MIGSNTPRLSSATRARSLYRRSMYTFWKRAAPPASMDILNAPNRETCTVRRDRTNTPLQALVTLNDAQFVEAARHLAQTALLASREGKPPEADEATIDFIASACSPVRSAGGNEDRPRQPRRTSVLTTRTAPPMCEQADHRRRIEARSRRWTPQPWPPGRCS